MRIPTHALVIGIGMIAWGVFLLFVGVRYWATGVPPPIHIKHIRPGGEVFAGLVVIAMAIFGMRAFANEGRGRQDDDGRGRS